MSAYEDDADKFAEHVPETCDEDYCQICEELEEASGYDPKDDYRK